MWLGDDQISAAIKSAPRIAETTKATYAQSLKKATRSLGKATVAQVLAAPDRSFAALRLAIPKDETLRNTVTALIVAMTSTSMGRDHPEALRSWRGHLATVAARLEAIRGDGHGTARQQEAHVPWAEVTAALRSLRPDDDDALVLAMFVMIPPRRPMDYSRVSLFAPDDPPPEEAPKLPAWINVSTGRMRINAYKTAKTYRAYETTLPERLVQVIRASLERTPRRFLFQHANGRPYPATGTANGFTQHCIRAFRRIFKSRPVSCNVLRHSFATHLALSRPSLKEWEAAARAMGHSLSRCIEYGFPKGGPLGGPAVPP
jgi:hypothetical protein